MKKRQINRILSIISLLLLSPSIISAILILRERIELSESLNLILLIPNGLLMISLWYLIASNPEKIDKFFDKLNVFGLPRFPKERVIRVNFYRRFAYAMLGITALNLALIVVFLFLKLSGML